VTGDANHIVESEGTKRLKNAFEKNSITRVADFFCDWQQNSRSSMPNSASTAIKDYHFDRESVR